MRSCTNAISRYAYALSRCVLSSRWARIASIVRRYPATVCYALPWERQYFHFPSTKILCQSCNDAWSSLVFTFSTLNSCYSILQRMFDAHSFEHVCFDTNRYCHVVPRQHNSPLFLNSSTSNIFVGCIALNSTMQFEHSNLSFRVFCPHTHTHTLTSDSRTDTLHVPVHDATTKGIQISKLRRSNTSIISNLRSFRPPPPRISI